MPQLIATQTNPTKRSHPLQRLRSEAGFRTARDFAAKVGIPESTYSRYERSERGPYCGIPLSNAWLIADALGATIDQVVGREPLAQAPQAPAAPTLDDRAACLDAEGRAMLESYLAYLESHQPNSDTEGRR